MPPAEVLALIGKDDAHQLLERLYGNNLCAQCAEATVTPEPVRWIASAAQQAFTLGRDVSPVISLLRQLSIARRNGAGEEHPGRDGILS